MGYTNSIFEGLEGTFLEEDGRGLYYSVGVQPSADLGKVECWGLMEIL